MIYQSFLHGMSTLLSVGKELFRSRAPHFMALVWLLSAGGKSFAVLMVLSGAY